MNKRFMPMAMRTMQTKPNIYANDKGAYQTNLLAPVEKARKQPWYTTHNLGGPSRSLCNIKLPREDKI